MNATTEYVGPRIKFTYTGLVSPSNKPKSIDRKLKLPNLNRRPFINFKKRRYLINEFSIKHPSKQLKFTVSHPKPDSYFKKDTRPPRFY